MDPQRFDLLSKAIAGRLTRRRMLGGLGAGGLGAAILGDAPVLSAPGATTCVYAFDATIDVGPSSTVVQTKTISGELTITIGPDGAIDSGALIQSDGTNWPAVGQAVGRAINLRFSVPKTGAFIAIGVGRRAIASCTTAISGPASGPSQHDAGSWSATLKTGDSSGAAATAVTTEVSANESSSGAPASGPESTVAPTTEPTMEPTTATMQPTADCQVTCDANSTLDIASCTCVCTAGTTTCREVTVGTAGGGCVDLSTDTSNCGSCGHQCPGIENEADPVCVNGSCDFSCLGGLVTCSLDAVCKTFLDRDNGHCGSCGNACGGATPKCVDSVCTCDLACASGTVPDANCTLCVRRKPAP
jgi:hypothetical protein